MIIVLGLILSAIISYGVVHLLIVINGLRDELVRHRAVLSRRF